MDKERYSTIEDKDGYGRLTAAESALAYSKPSGSATGVVYMDEEAKKIDHIPLGMFGFYTDNPEAFEKHVAEIEADMDEVDAGIEDPKKWISSEQMWTELYQKYPWLR